MYCIYCGKESKTNKGNCSHCGQPLIENESLTYDESRSLNQKLHDRLTKSRDEFNAGMVGVVLGATLLIIGVLFFVLSYKVPDDPDTIGKVLKTTCFEFWVSMAGLGVGGILFLSGLVRVFIQKAIVEREIMRALEAVQEGTYKHGELKSVAK